MLKQLSPAVLLLALGSTTVLMAQRNTIPSGTQVTVRTDSAIKADADTTNGTRMYSATFNRSGYSRVRENLATPRSWPRTILADRSGVCRT